MTNFKKCILPFATAMAMATFMLNCSGTATTGTTDTTAGNTRLTTVDALPNATGPVVGSASASVSFLTQGGPSYATTGLNFADTTSEDFSSDSSFASCEMFNHSKEAIKSAAQGDMILCFVQSIFATQEDLDFDIYDGEYHVLALDTSGIESEDEEQGLAGAPDKIRLRVVKNADGNITNFEMQSCAGGVQQEYLNQTIDVESGEFTMVSKGYDPGDEEYGEFRHETQVSASLNSEGKYVDEKRITVLFDGGNAYGTTNFAQTSDQLTADSVTVFDYTYEDTTYRSVSSVQAAAELIDGNEADTLEYNLSLLAMGDGAVKYSYTNYDGDDNELWVDGDVEGWNGDTLLIDADASADFITMVTDAVLSDNTTAPTLVFEASEEFDCDSEIEATINLALSEDAVMDSCSDLISMNHSWVDCWNTINPGEEGDGEDFE